MASTAPTRSGDNPGRNDLVGLLDRGLNQHSKRQTSFRPLVKNRRADLFFGRAVMHRFRFNGLTFQRFNNSHNFRVTPGQISRSTSVNGWK
jgi:hypothetical protein